MSVNKFGLSENTTKSEVSKKYVDSKFITLTKNLQTKVDKDGDIMTGNLNMNGQQLTGLVTPTDDDEACNKKYVDLKAAELKSESSLMSIYFNTLMNNLTIQNKIGYIPILNSNWDSKYGFKVSASSERPDSKLAFNAFTYKKSEWITHVVNRNFWIQIQCPERIKIWRFALRGKDGGQDCIYKWKLQGTNDIASSIWDTIYSAVNDKVNMVMRYFHVNPKEGYINYRIFVEEAEGQNPGLSYWQLYTVDNVLVV